MSETKRERYIRILSGLGGADISSEACKELVELLKEQPETAAQTAESAQNVSNEDLISRKAAIDAIKSRKTAEQSRAGIMRNAVVDFCIDIVKKLPSAQPERPKGEWMVSHIPDSMLWECNQCGFDCGAHSFNFCPNCGADMRGEQDE